MEQESNMTNYERIKAMSVDEMAAFLGQVDCYECPFAGVACECFSDERCKKLLDG